MNKRGSAYLRKAIYQAAFIAAFHDPVFSAYYQQKRAEEKHHKVAVGAVARKLCHTIYDVMKNNTPYKSSAIIKTIARLVKTGLFVLHKISCTCRNLFSFDF